ncbi:hypothetical protein JCM33374_g3400 [Metschnikowia sp. JCM 33374]|nr:hypothetical protein JCM33374_g3400 [Metschnikowia sp. JCM 33374]
MAFRMRAATSSPELARVAKKPGAVPSLGLGPIANPSPLPTLFVSHGGPTFLYENDDFGNKGAWRTVRNLGKTITDVWQPDYIVVVSAHWQSSGSNLIEVAVPPKSNAFGADVGSSSKHQEDWMENPLIYDFYGFPDYMYKEKFRTWNSRFISESITDHLESCGFHAKLTERGLDHGVWVPLKVAFPQPEDNTMALPKTPLIQVSLTGLESDFATHARLGEVLAHFQNNKIWDPTQERHLQGMVVCSGMSVHNLRDLGVAMNSGKKALPYVSEFGRLVSQAVQNGSQTLSSLNKLKTDYATLLHKAHPTLEHFVPLVVAAGLNNASNNRPVSELYNDEQLSLGWGTFQFGEYPVKDEV